MRTLGSVAAVAAALWVTGLSARADAGEAFKLFIAESGVYQVGFEALAKAGLRHPVDSAAIGMSCSGGTVPLWVDDGGDGKFGPGDRLEFVGERLAGERSYYNPYSRLNVCRLELATSAPARMIDASTSGCTSGDTNWVASRHLEEDILRIRFDSRADEHQEVWFWSQISQITRDPFRHELDLSGLEAGGRVSMRLHLRGWSSLPREIRGQYPDHRLEILLNGETLTTTEWNNATDGQVIDLAAVPSDRFSTGANELSLRVPKRRLIEGERPVVDVVLLNWIEIDYPRSARIGAGQARLGRGADPDCSMLTTGPDDELFVYLPGGRRIADATAGGRHLLPPAAMDETVDVVVAGGFREPLVISRDLASDLSTRPRRADYIIITHPRLADAVRPLAEFHETRGRRVEVVDVRDVYDEFNHGIVHPRAIRSFLAHAYREWAAPAPRWVLLVGDASWDANNFVISDANYADWSFRPGQGAGFIKNRSTPYDDVEHNVRGLIPTFSYGTREGHAASDNWFVDVEGDDLYPEMAIGRFPVVEPEEVAAIVEKTLRYASRPPVGPWRRRVLWITNNSKVLQRQTDELAMHLASSGYDDFKVYPSLDQIPNSEHRETLLRAFDDGQYLVHFIGHGGRYIWRTGAPDLENNKDLFTLDDLDRLSANQKLPIILSMTCYSAPFDHPVADSIGEKFLRLKGRGAVAVIAAAWRNAPTARLSRILLNEMIEAETVGEAFMRAKRNSTDTDFIRQYNLLGDPALPIRLPTLRLQLELVGDEPLRVRGTTGDDAEGGAAEIEWLAASGETVHRETRKVRETWFEFSFGAAAATVERPDTVRVYLTSADGTLDGIGGLRLPDDGPGAGNGALVSATDNEDKGGAR